eukprot:2093488-Pyramimonas_sp.AAC.1
MAVQEHHVEQGQCTSWEAKLKGTGWRARMEPALATGRGGSSGGLLQAVPGHQGLAEVEHVPVTIANGRASALHASGLTPCGFLWVNVYLHDGEQLGPRNWAVLNA